MCCAVQTPAGLKELFVELASSSASSGSNSAAAFAFLASCIKDHGAVPQAIQLLQRVGEDFAWHAQ